jgi:glycosyltransferase involved in cell wall biosynthesis
MNRSVFRQLRVAVVVPAFNEARKIAATVASIPEYVDDIFVIDDASTDETAAAATSARVTPVHVVRHEQNKGVGGAIATG